MIESSEELQSIVLSSLLKDSYLYPKTSKYITKEFFSKYTYRVIYDSLKYYYEKYSVLPSRNELLTIISELNDSKVLPSSEVKSECITLYDSPTYNEDFILDTMTSFIQRNNVENVLKRYLPKINDSTDKVSTDKIGADLAQGLSFSISKSSSFKLSDIDMIGEIRREAIGTDDNPMIIPSSIPSINKSLQFHGYKPGDLIMICSPPGVGKTMFMVNEGANASILGYKVLHLFIGDMKEYDGFIRYTSRITEIPQNDIVEMTVADQSNLVKKHNLQGYFNNIVVSSYAAGEITIEEMIQEVYRIQKDCDIHFDMILVDYADNLLPDSTMMYESGGNIYNKLSLLGYSNHSIVIVGSQPKPAYWDTEIIPKSAAADSSRKQHVIDVMITMGKAAKGADIGSIHLPKVRRGREGSIIRIKSYFERAYLQEISEKDYINMKGELYNYE